MVVLTVKRGISSPAVTSIPEKWDRQWFRYFIDNFLTNADIRNVATGSGITISGNVSGNNTAGNSTSVTISQSPVPSNTVMGNVSGASAIPTAISQGQLTALLNLFTNTLQGAVPASGGGTANFLRADGTWNLPVGSAAIANNTVLGNVSGSTATPVALNTTQLTTLVNVFTSGLSGAVPASAGGTVNFLRADGTFAPTSTVTSANPTALAGPTAVNGAAATFMTSDSAPAINQGSAYVWSASHNFNALLHANLGLAVIGAPFTSRGITDNGVSTALTISSSQTVATTAPGSGNTSLTINGATSAVALSVVSGNSSVTGGADFNILRAGSTINNIGQGPGMVLSDTTNLTSMSWQHSGGQTELWQNNSGVVSPTWLQILKVLTTHGVVINAPVSGETLSLSSNLGSFSATGNPAVTLKNANSGAQTPVDFFSNGTFTGRVRNDSAGNMAYVSLLSGTHVFFVGGDSGVGVQSFQIKSGVVNLVGHTTTVTAPAAGGAGALPATPKGYVTIQINGTAQQIAYY